MINSNPRTARTELQDLQQNNSRGVISNATRATGTFAVIYQLATSLKIPIIDAGPGFDVNDLKKKLGATRFNALIAGLKRQFVCNHATDSSGNEIPCVYAEDVEKFLHEESN